MDSDERRRFVLASEVQKLLMVVYADPTPLTQSGLADKAKLPEDDVERTLEHLVASGILAKHNATADDQAQTYSVDAAFVFQNELHSIALKSFAAAETVRTLLRSKFKDSVVQAFVLGEDSGGVVEVSVVHRQKVLDEAETAAAMQKLSKACVKRS